MCTRPIRGERSPKRTKDTVLDVFIIESVVVVVVVVAITIVCCTPKLVGVVALH